MKLRAHIVGLLNGQISILPLVTFRALFGLVVAYGALRFMTEGWVEELIGLPTYYFSYSGFEWVPRPSVAGAYLLYSLIAASAVAVALGWRYRWSTRILVCSFLYAQLLDATNYLNHYYLVVLLAGLLCIIPAANCRSLDVAAGRVPYTPMVPAWMLYVLLFQVAVVYVFAGVAKINSDWLLRAMPMAVWLPERAWWPVLGQLFEQPITAYIFSWLGMLYDCTIVVWLSWPRTRPYAYIAVLGFHILVGLMFSIGLFPLIMISATLLFFSPAWHERLWAGFDSAFAKLITPTHPVAGTRFASLVPLQNSIALKGALLMFCLVQLVLPLRAWAISGPVAWSEEGYRFGWRVMLVEKIGYAAFTVVDAAGHHRQLVNVADYLTPYQHKQMAVQPDFIVQFAQHLAADYMQRGWSQPQVYADVYVSLNGRRSKRLIDPDFDLAGPEVARYSAWKGLLSPKPWILPYR